MRHKGFCGPLDGCCVSRWKERNDSAMYDLPVGRGVFFGAGCGQNQKMPTTCQFSLISLIRGRLSGSMLLPALNRVGFRNDLYSWRPFVRVVVDRFQVNGV